MFGLSFLTPRHPRYQVGDLTGWQMTCTKPSHNTGRACTKEAGISKHGSDDLVQRLLKTWIILGCDTETADDHRAVWDLIVGLGDGVPSNADLDASIEYDWGSRAKVDCDDLTVCEILDEGPANKRPRTVKATELLAPPPAGTASKFHKEMEDLAVFGVIPATTQEQRDRNKPCSKTKYRVPPGLHLALKGGYIGPNLPPPAGMVWRALPGCWALCRQGG